MHACIAETHARKGGREKHLLLGFVVVRVLDGTRKILDGALQRLQAEDVADGVRALVGRSFNWVIRTRDTLGIGDGGPGFERVAEDVEAGAGVDLRGHGARVEGVTDAEGGL